MKKLVIALDNMEKQKAKDFVSEISSSLDSNQIVYKVNDLLALV
jgi:orotidine-5'-phosphate decarboxylase